MRRARHPRKPYLSDVTDAQWAILAPLIPPSRTQRGGRPPEVDTLGLLVAILITGAGVDDGVAAPMRLANLSPVNFPRLVLIYGDRKDHHQLQAWMAAHRPHWRIEVKRRPEGAKGFTSLEKRWVVERTNAWHGRYRRNSKDYERKPRSSAAMMQISHIHLMLNRLALCHCPPFHDREAAA